MPAARKATAEEAEEPQATEPSVLARCPICDRVLPPEPDWPCGRCGYDPGD